MNYRFSLLYIILLAWFFPACSPTEHTAADLQLTPIYESLQRVIGPRATDFELQLQPDSSSATVLIRATGGKVQIVGNSPVALTYGAYFYLKNTGALQVSWEGEKEDLTAIWPDFPETRLNAAFLYRQYLNVCAFGYSTPWWDWRRWEKEIDWMALHGINMPTAMEGQEAVYLKLWEEMGIPQDTILNYFSGPAFLPWHRMGNINHYGGPLPLNYIRKKEELQKRILARMKDLGMKPVVPAFSGYVPPTLKNKFPNAEITQLASWNEGLEGTFLLNPTDSLFNRIGRRFIELYTEMYGEADFYLADSFNEMEPPVTTENKLDMLAQYGEAVYKPIAQTTSGATWVMQGWLFGHDREFWDNASIKAFLSKVPQDSMIIQDFGNDRYPDIWKKADAYVGKQWTYGYVHNYGGSNPVYGDFDFYNEQFKNLVSNPDVQALKGYGVLPEGIQNNSIVYEYLYDLPWTADGLNWDQWMQTYTKARYGRTNESILTAWSTLKDAVYTTRYWTPRWWEGSAGAYLFFKRPTVDIVNFQGHPGDANKIPQAATALLSQVQDPGADSLLLYDIIDFTRHYTSIKLDSLLQGTVLAYQQNKIKEGDQMLNQIDSLVEKLDPLIGYQPLNNLHQWLQSAYDYGNTEEESWFYVWNARTQITVWGGTTLKDYASKSWQGMFKDYYLPRWKIFLAALRTSTLNHEKFDEKTVVQKIKAWELDWCSKHDLGQHIATENPVQDAKTLLQLFQ